MNSFNYKNLTPFKWFVLENFPFIEADFDALTNWQLFCKLGKEINKIINSTNNLGKEVEKISDYLNNLDLQEEVNNKLDEMTRNGELTEIFAQYLGEEFLIAFPTYNNDDDINTSTEGDCSIIKTKNKCLIIDTMYTDNNFTSIQQTMNRLNIDKIDYFLITHYHLDHYGNLSNFVNNFDVSNCIFLLPRIPNNPNVRDTALQGYNTITSILNEKGLTFRFCDNETINLDNIPVRFFNASIEDLNYYDNTLTSDYNNYSICCDIIYNGRKILFVGDTDSLGLNHIAENYLNSNYDLLKDAHHGYASIAYNFTELVNPKNVLIPVTKGMWLNSNYKEAQYPNYWASIGSNQIVLGYQTENVIYKISNFGLYPITKNYYLQGFELTFGYRQKYYVDYNNAKSLRLGTQEYPFKYLREANLFINKKQPAIIEIEILSSNENKIIDLTDYKWLRIIGNNNIINNLNFRNCDYVYINGVKINNVGTDYALNCENGIYDLYNISTDSESTNFIRISKARVTFYNDLSIKNKYTPIKIYSNSIVSFNLSNLILENFNSFIDTGESLVNFSDDTINLLKNINLLKIIPLNLLKLSTVSKNYYNLFELYNGEVKYDSVDLNINKTNFSKLKIYFRDVDGIKFIEEIPTDTQYSKISSGYRGSDSYPNEYYLKTCRLTLNANNIILDRQCNITFSNTGNAFSQQNVIGIYKVEGII